MRSGYIPQSERKKILLLCDDIRMHSGIGNMGKEIILNTAHHYNWLNLGAGIKHPEAGKIFDLSEEVNKHTGIKDSYVRVIPNDGYGDPMLIRSLIKTQKPDVIMIFTDPRYWVWLFQIEREIRSKIPIVYLNIWDNFPAPLYNRPYYESVDGLFAISKQTKFINEIVLGESSKDKILRYIPHGVDENVYFSIDESSSCYNDYVETKNQIFKGKDLDFIALFNSRNIRRKGIGELILGYRYFCESIGEERSKKSALVLHTEPSNDAGTDLVALKDALCNTENINIYFSTKKLPSAQINYLYNFADVTILPSSNEGWGLSLTESMMAGTMIIANMTGGMQDQMRVEDASGKWFTPTSDIPSNHRGTFKKTGEWAIPVYPTARHLVGSPPTPYIFDDICSPEDIGKAIRKVWELTPEERKTRGLAGRQWAMSEEAGFTSRQMGNRIIEGIDNTLDNFKPRTSIELIKVEEREMDLVSHKIFEY